MQDILKYRYWEIEEKLFTLEKESALFKEGFKSSLKKRPLLFLMKKKEKESGT